MKSLTRIFAASSLVLAAASLTACSDPNKARSTLDKAGYTDIETTGYAFLGCDESDTFSTGFKAKNPRGQEVEGVVCSSLIGKGATIRF